MAIFLPLPPCRTHDEALIDAIRGNFQEWDDLSVLSVQALIGRGANVNFGSFNASPLYYAASRGNAGVIKVLLQNGADINKGHISGDTPLTEAARNGHKDVVAQLLAAGAAVNRFTNGGKTPLVMAAFGGYLEIINILLQNGADVNMCDGKGDTALAYAAQKLTNSHIIRHLLSKGADVNKLGKTGTTPLMFAVADGSIENVKILVENGADINIRDSKGDTAIDYAARGANSQNHILEYLKNLFVKEETRRIALQTKTFSRCIITNNLEVAKILIANEVNVNKPEDSGETPLVCAVKTGTLEMIELLLNNGAQFSIPSALLAAIIADKAEIVHLLVKKGADVNRQYTNGNTPLLQAIEVDNLKIAKLLIENGADVNLITDNQDTALSRAAFNANFKMFDYLLNAGADLDQVKEKLDEVAENNEDFATYLNSVRKQRVEGDLKKMIDTFLSSGAGSNQEEAPL